jgi:DNA repair protein RadD
VLGPTFEELKAAGRLVGSRIFAPVRPDLKGVKIRQGDYVESDLAAAMDKRKLVGDVVTHWLRHAEGRRTVVFATGVQHSIHIRDEFRAAGVLAEHIDGSTPREERDSILARLKAGRVQVVTNCMVLTEGWDQPEVGCIILARPTKRIGMYVQMVGRGMRASPGKTDVIIIDHSGAVHDFGLPEDEITWTLDTDKKAVNEAHEARKADPHRRGLATCPKCSALRMEGDPCGSCGWRPVTKSRYVEFQDGDLGEVRRDRNVHVSDQNEFTFYRELVAIHRFKKLHNPSIKEGWIAWKFKDRFGRFPPWDWAKLDPVDPTAATISWVRSRDIAYAKSMGPR